MKARSRRTYHVTDIFCHRSYDVRSNDIEKVTKAYTVVFGGFLGYAIYLNKAAKSRLHRKHPIVISDYAGDRLGLSKYALEDKAK